MLNIFKSSHSLKHEFVGVDVEGGDEKIGVGGRLEAHDGDVGAARVLHLDHSGTTLGHGSEELVEVEIGGQDTGCRGVGEYGHEAEALIGLLLLPLLFLCFTREMHVDTAGAAEV